MPCDRRATKADAETEELQLFQRRPFLSDWLVAIDAVLVEFAIAIAVVAVAVAVVAD